MSKVWKLSPINFVPDILFCWIIAKNKDLPDVLTSLLVRGYGEKDGRLPLSDKKSKDALHQLTKKGIINLDTKLKDTSSVPICVCASCKKPSLKMKKCAGCESVNYCSKECQKQHWKEHKAVCIVAQEQSKWTKKNKLILS